MTPGGCIIGCWLAFVLFWCVSALSVKPALERQGWRQSAAYKSLMTAGGLLLYWHGYTFPLNLRLLPLSYTTAWIGAALCAAGLLGALWSRSILAGNWSSSVTFKKDHELVERGPYRFVRHPIYTSILLMCIGTAVAIGDVGAWLGVVLMAVGLWIKLSHEEQLLTRHFPNEYPSYQSRVKALIPFVL